MLLDDLAEVSMAGIPNIMLDSKSQIMTRHGAFDMLGYAIGAGPSMIVVLVKGDLKTVDRPLVRVHSKCVTSEVFGSRQCDCARQLEVAFDNIENEGVGVIVYLDQEARGNGLRAKLQIYESMQQGFSSWEACRRLGYEPDVRTYEGAAAVLQHLRIQSMRLLTNNPDKIAALQGFGIVVERVPCSVDVDEHSEAYMREKRARGHLI